MGNARSSDLLRQVRTLFGAGTVTGLSDAQLLERFASRTARAAEDIHAAELAFEALVARHGPMVLGVCRRALADPEDVEDAFQATFLVLVRRAASVRATDSLGRWLYGVSRRVAAKARSRSRRDRRRTTPLQAELTASDPANDQAGLLAALDDEVSRLPAKYRAPVILCHLEGLSHAEAAARLRWPVGTVSGRLSRARGLLKDRLVRRGLAPATGSLGVLLAAGGVRAAVPKQLATVTVRAALDQVNPTLTAGAVSAAAGSLAREVLEIMLLTRQMLTAAAFLGTGLMTWAAAAVTISRLDEPQKSTRAPAPIARQATHTTAPQPVPEPDPLDTASAFPVRGRVLDPDGKPATGATVYRTNATFRHVEEPSTAVLLTRAGPDGSFRLSPADAKVALNHIAPLGFTPQIVVTAEGCGPAFVDSSVGDDWKRIRLVKDDVPIRGRLIDLQGRPVVGATIQLVGILWHPSGNLDEFLRALKTADGADHARGRGAYFASVTYRLMRYWASDEIPSMFPAAVTTTDREGRFTIKGVGRERIASLLVSGPGIETLFAFAATRDMPTVKADDTYHGAACDLVAGPGLEIVGTVRDQDTGKPLAGVTVQNTAAFGIPGRFLKTKTDAEGRYRFLGLPPRTIFGDGQDVLAVVKDGPAYLASVQHVGDAREPGPVRKDFALKRGAWAHGRVTDQPTGKPVRVGLGYHVLADNPHRNDYPSYAIRFGTPFSSDENGEFQIAVMPGRGILGARPIYSFHDRYRRAVGIDKLEVKKIGPIGQVRATRPQFIAAEYSTLVAINPKDGDNTVKVDIKLDPGRTVTGKLIGPDGEPVVGALWLGTAERFEMWSTPNTLPSADFEMHVASKGKCGLLFYHEGKQLAGAYVGEPDDGGPVTVKLERCGTLTGRLIDDGGRPRTGVLVSSDRPYDEGESRFENGSLPKKTRTDPDGRFRLSGLVPGMKYSLSVWRDDTIFAQPVKDVITHAGETKDLGDVKVGGSTSLSRDPDLSSPLGGYLPDQCPVTASNRRTDA